MDLTNFIWHLGAALAALWAGFAYRANKSRLVELENGVLASLLELECEVDETPEPVLKRRRVSARARALRWFAAELARTQGVQVEFLNKQALVDLAQTDWLSAVRRLFALLTHKAFFDRLRGQTCQLVWCIEGGAGHWSIVNRKGGQHDESCKHM